MASLTAPHMGLLLAYLSTPSVILYDSQMDAVKTVLFWKAQGVKEGVPTYGGDPFTGPSGEIRRKLEMEFLDCVGTPAGAQRFSPGETRGLLISAIYDR